MAQTTDSIHIILNHSQYPWYLSTWTTQERWRDASLFSDLTSDVQFVKKPSRKSTLEQDPISDLVDVISVPKASAPRTAAPKKNKGKGKKPKR